MILHIGAEQVVQTKTIVAIVDAQETLPEDTAALLEKLEGESALFRIGEEDIKSVVICFADGKTKAYLSPISPATLKKRSTYIEEISAEGGATGKEGQAI
jgi:hypothetical protein